jgi:uncharacterized membrane protein YdbT with pleckstrin-like domain
MKKREYLFKVFRSRKAYFLIYLMNLIIIFLLIFLFFNGYNIEKFQILISTVFILFSIVFIEIHRIKDWWAITNSSFVQSLSILNKNVREVDFSSISDLDLEQPFLKRILNYGDVNVRLFLNETSIKIKNISKPREFMEKLQDTMFANRRNNSKEEIKNPINRR